MMRYNGITNNITLFASTLKNGLYYIMRDRCNYFT